MVDRGDKTGDQERGFEINRRSVLKATAVSAVGAGLYSGTASATDDTAIFDIECVGNEVRVTLNEVALYRGRGNDLDDLERADPADLDDLQVFLGTFDNINTSGNNRIDSSEIKNCFAATEKGGTCPSPVAFPESTEIVGDSVVFTFDRFEAGLDTEIDPGRGESVVLAGVYRTEDGEYQSFDSYGQLEVGRGPIRVGFDPAECPCTVCGDDGEADGITQLTLRNGSGETLSTVEVYNDKESKAEALIDTFTDVAPGDDIGFSAPSEEDELKNDISVYVDGVKNAEIHTSCSKPLGPGIKKGDFLVVSGVDTNDNELCGFGCVACGDGGEADGVSELTFRNGRDSDVDVIVYNDKEAKEDARLFEGTVSANGDGIEDEDETFTVSAPADEDELENEISIYVDENGNGQGDPDERVAVFHTSCSRLLGPGAEEGGFEVVAGRDKSGQALCDLDLDDCVECGTGADDAEKVSELSFRFLGDDDSTVEVYNDNDAKADKLLFRNTDVDNGDTFAVEAPIENDEFASDISLWVNGSKDIELHTSCSQPLGRGILKGDFRIVGGKDRSGRPLCDVECALCGDDGEADGVSRLRFRNVSGETLEKVTVYNDKEAKDDAVLFGPRNRREGRTFTVSAPADEDELENEISIYVDSDGDGVPDKRVAVFHTSCSQLLGPGTEEGGFAVVSGRDKAGRALCDLDLTGCRECGTGADDAEKVSELTFRNDSDSDGIVVYNDKDAKDDEVLFEGTVAPGSEFTVSAPPEKDEFETDISIWLDTDGDGVGDEKNTEIHTSCSKPLGPGLTFGDFYVVEAKDKDGYPLCEIETDGPDGCVECGTGEDDAEKVSELTFENQSGAATGDVLVYNDKDAKAEDLLDKTDVSGDSFTVSAPSDENEFETDISIWLDTDGDGAGDVKNTEIHTSCSKPLGPGIKKGDFLITGAKDKNGRTLCDIGCAECGEGADDADKIVELTLENDSSVATEDVVVYNDKDAKEEDRLETEVVDDRLTFSAPAGEDELETDISVWLDTDGDGTGDEKDTEIHTSCSRPLGVGDTFGSFTVIGGRDKAGRKLCGSP